MRKIPREKAQSLACLDGRAGEHDPAYCVALERIDRTGHGQVGLAGSGGTDTESDVVTEDGAEVFALPGRSPLKVCTAGVQHR